MEPWETPGYSSTPWTPMQTAGALSWSSETFAQNQNANAIRWGTLYNFRFDSNRPPQAMNATIGFFKTGSANHGWDSRPFSGWWSDTNTDAASDHPNADARHTNTYPCHTNADSCDADANSGHTDTATCDANAASGHADTDPTACDANTASCDTDAYPNSVFLCGSGRDQDRLGRPRPGGQQSDLHHHCI